MAHDFESFERLDEWQADWIKAAIASIMRNILADVQVIRYGIEHGQLEAALEKLHRLERALALSELEAEGIDTEA